MSSMPSPALALRRLPAAELLALRPGFLPTPEALQAFVRRVYAALQACCPDYQGGRWEAYALEDGSWFLAPVMPGVLRLQDGEGNTQAMAPWAAGLVATILAVRDTEPPASALLSQVLFQNALEVLAEGLPDADAVGCVLEAALV